MRLERDAAVQTACAPGYRIGRPAGPARAGSRRHANGGRNHGRCVQRFRLDRPVDPKHIVKAQGPATLHIVAADHSRKLIEIERRRLIGSKPQGALAASIDRAGGELAFKPKLAAERPVRRHVEPRRLAVGRDDAIKTEQPEQRAGPIGFKPAVDANIGAGQRAEVGHHECLALAGRARRDIDPDCADFAGQADLTAGAVGAAALHADAGLQRRGLLAGGNAAQRSGQRRRKPLR